ncbi:MAG TPA: BTAD domain-containing putative transcriptional regulator [Pseudonocardiaceae bacterium]
MKGHVLADRIVRNSEDDPMFPRRPGVLNEKASLSVLGQFDLAVDGRSVPLGAISQRLLTLVAIKSGQISRNQAAGIMWPDTRAPRAAANLRSVVWRLQQTCSGVVVPSFYDLRLAHDVTVDIHQSSRVAFELLDHSKEMAPAELKKILRCNLYDDIAADLGNNDWLIAERERFRQLRVHALESLATQLLEADCHGLAIEAALGAVRADPFRERPRHLLVAAHLAEGSKLEARRQFDSYCDLLRAELGSSPSEDFIMLGRTNGFNVCPPPRP